MTASDHAKILGIIFLIVGGLGILGIVFGLIFLLGMGGAAVFNSGNRNGEALPIAIVFLIFGAFLLLAVVFIIPQMIAGWNLLKGNGRAKIWVILGAIINVINFPIGTAIGVYALWFTFGEEGKRYFRY